MVSPIMMSLDAGQADDVARRGIGTFDALQAVEHEELRHLCALKRSVELADSDRIADLDPTVEDAARCEAAEVVAGVEVRHNRLEWRRGRARQD
jgi:hypothetical protein